MPLTSSVASVSAFSVSSSSSPSSPGSGSGSAGNWCEKNKNKKEYIKKNIKKASAQNEFGVVFGELFLYLLRNRDMY